ncbi:MAG: cysteine dioxygenase family protein [Bacteroidales bacterium]|nr:cysteine dioxygenase family protein [Bacteroidales bacterium]
MEAFLPDSIKNIIDSLEKTRNPDNRVLNEIVANSGVAEKDFSSFRNFVYPANESYGRRLLFNSNRFKILLMSWRKNDFTSIHNHGATEWGCVYFMGKATHRIYENENAMLKMKRKDYFETGQIADVCGDFIHIMGNSGSCDFLTLHIYGSDSDSSGNESMAEIYAPEHNKLFYTHGEAYLNISKELIRGEQYFDQIDPDTLVDYLILVKPFYERVNNESALEKIKSAIKMVS